MVSLKTGIILAGLAGAYILYRSFGGGLGIGRTVGSGLGSGIGGFGSGIVEGFNRGFGQWFQGFQFQNPFSAQTPTTSPHNQRNTNNPNTESPRASSQTPHNQRGDLDSDVYSARNLPSYYRRGGGPI